MNASAVPRTVAVSRAARASAVAALLVDERDRDTQGVALPRPEVHLVVRLGPSVRSGLDVHAMGGREQVLRKRLHTGHRFVTARLHLGAAESVLGVPASALTGSVVALEDLWGAAATRRLLDRFARTSNTLETAAILESAIAERFATGAEPFTRMQLVLDAASRLTSANVSAVAADLGVSERHLRRVFDRTIGVSPKTFVKVTRFRRALHSARKENPASWATIATAAGYYDQAHLIAEFRAIAGVTPRALLGELSSAQPIG